MQRTVCFLNSQISKAATVVITGWWSSQLTGTFTPTKSQGDLRRLGEPVLKSVLLKMFKSHLIWGNFKLRKKRNNSSGKFFQDTLACLYMLWAVGERYRLPRVLRTQAQLSE